MIDKFLRALVNFLENYMSLILVGAALVLGFVLFTFVYLISRI